jgi:hypothetical protein
LAEVAIKPLIFLIAAGGGCFSSDVGQQTTHPAMNHGAVNRLCSRCFSNLTIPLGLSQAVVVPDPP